MGLRVIGIDGGNEKRTLCMDLGCEAFVDFTEAKDVVGEVVTITDGKGAHGVIVTASSGSAYNIAPKMLRVGGLVMCVGLRKSTLSHHASSSNLLMVVITSTCWKNYRWSRTF